MALLLGVTWLLGVADPRTQKLAAVGVAATHLAFFSTTVYLLLAMLLAITALSTTFLGLLAILLLYGYRRKDVSRGDHARTLRQWLTHHNISLPSTAAIVSAINNKASKEILRPTATGEVCHINYNTASSLHYSTITKFTISSTGAKRAKGGAIATRYSSACVHFVEVIATKHRYYGMPAMPLHRVHHSLPTFFLTIFLFLFSVVYGVLC